MVLYLDLKQELNVKTRYTGANGTQQNGLSPGSETSTPNGSGGGLNGDIISHATDNTSTATLNSTNSTNNATSANINDYQLQQRSLKSKICRSLKKTKGVWKFTKKYRNRD